MPDLIELLRRFNRKERLFLVGDALGNKEFSLSECFRNRLRYAIEVEMLSMSSENVSVIVQ